MRRIFAERDCAVMGLQNRAPARIGILEDARALERGLDGIGARVLLALDADIFGVGDLVGLVIDLPLLHRHALRAGHDVGKSWSSETYFGVQLVERAMSYHSWRSSRATGVSLGRLSSWALRGLPARPGGQHGCKPGASGRKRPATLPHVAKISIFIRGLPTEKKYRRFTDAQRRPAGLHPMVKRRGPLRRDVSSNDQRPTLGARSSCGAGGQPATPPGPDRAGGVSPPKAPRPALSDEGRSRPANHTFRHQQATVS